MRRRRTAASEPEVTGDISETVDTDITEAVAVPADTAPTTPTEASAPDAETGAPPRRRRAPRPRKRQEEGEEPATPMAVPADAVEEPPTVMEMAPPAQAEPPADAAPVAPPDQEAANAAEAPPKRTRRRGPAKKAEPAPADAAGQAPADAAQGAPAVTAEPVADATPAGEAAPSPEAPAEDARPRRTRGRRPTKTAAAAEPPAPTYHALPGETLARLAETRVALRKGAPELVVNGEPRLPLWFFVNTEDPDSHEIAAREIRQAYDAGVRFFTLLAHLPWTTRSGERRYDPLDETLRFVAENAPEGFILPRLIFSPPASWERAHPDEMTLYPDGGRGDVSLASRRFWEEDADAALRAAVEHVAQGPYAERVFGFYLEHGEWFHDVTRGYDISPPNRDAFRAWLRTRYQNDVIALRAAWHDGGVTFETAEIPERRPPGSAPPTAPVLYQERERRYADFHEFSSEIVAQVITRLGRAVKQASGGRSAVAVSYGYTLELPRAGSGHLALARVLASPDIDILTGPVSYAARTPGGSAPLPTPVDSLALAGKLWVSEDDTKTFLARGETPDTYNPRVSSAQDTAAVHARNFGAALAHGAGVSWMDLWGQGWLDDRAVWEHIARLRTLSDRLATRRRNPRTKAVPPPDVAVFVDEQSFFGVRADERLLGRLVMNQRDALLRSGARLGFYLLSDLLRKNFPEAPRLLLFLNAFRFPDGVRAAIKERFQGDGRTLAWVYGPGCLETATDGTGEVTAGRSESVSELSDVIGMHLRLQAWSSRTGTLITDGRSPLTDGLRGQRLGEEERINPSFFVTDRAAQALGEYVQTGNASLAVRKHPTWQSVFIGETALTPALLRGLYRLAGVPSYTAEDDVAWIGDSLICLHSASGGFNTVALPEEAHLFDLLSGETLASGGRGMRIHLRPREVRLLFSGTAAEVSRLGGDPNAGPPGLSAAELPPPPRPFVMEPADTATRPDRDLLAEDEELMAAALATGAPFADKDAAGADVVEEESDTEEGAAPLAGDDAAAPGRKKRRRRRGRHGRAAEGGEDGSVASAPGMDAVGPVASAEAPGEAHGDAARMLPPLSELLPDSELVDGDLPPVPDEFLPLQVRSDEAGVEQPQEGLEETPAARPRRRGRSRARRGGQSGAREGSPLTESAAESDPSGGSADSEGR